MHLVINLIPQVSFTFGIEGVSRALTHQLVRHRIASYSQKSQRYVKEGQFEYIMPPTIEADEVSEYLFKDFRIKLVIHHCCFYWDFTIYSARYNYRLNVFTSFLYFS